MSTATTSNTHTASGFHARTSPPGGLTADAVETGPVPIQLLSEVTQNVASAGRKGGRGSMKTTSDGGALAECDASEALVLLFGMAWGHCSSV